MERERRYGRTRSFNPADKPPLNSAAFEPTTSAFTM